MVAAKMYKKTFELSRDGKIVIYPSLYGQKEKGRIWRALRRLVGLRKD